jgi:uncharacterized cysteine cluster protein YcgN (CxxCxxCC family)
MTQLPVLNQEDAESLCRRCGVSCHMSLEVGEDKYVIEEIHCRFLGKGGDGHFTCTVYEKRFEVAPWCHTAAHAAKSGNLANDCLYAAHIPGYKGKQWAPAEIRGKLIPLVRRKLISEGLPLAASPESAMKVLTAGGEAWSYTEQAGRFTFHRKS